MATQRVLQLLRSLTTYADFTAAKSAIEGITGKKDGEIVLGRYGNATDGYFSAIGVYDSGHTKWTVFKSSDEIQAAITALQTELNNTQTGAGLGDDGSYTAPTSGQPGYEVLGGQNAPANIKDAVMALADAIAAMDHTNNYTAASGEEPNVVPAHATDASKVISGVNQVNGVLDTVTTDAVDLLLTGYQNTNASGVISSNDTLENALSKLENATSAGVQLSAKDGNQIARLRDDASTTDVNEAGLYTHVEIAQLTAQEITNLSDSNVREAYKLIDADSRTAIGDVIKIYKDSALQLVYLGTQNDTINATTGVITEDSSITDKQSLNFKYLLADGTYSLVKLDVSKFLTESEFGDGLDVSSTGVVSVKAGDGLVINATSKAVDVNPGNGIEISSDAVAVKIDTTSEKDSQATPADFLTVGTNGVKVQGIKDEIDRKIAASGISAAGDNYITAAVDGTDNKKINVTADVQALSATAGTAGVYNATTGAETTAPTNGTLSGTADSLADAADIATKVKTYVDGQIAIEAARSDAKNVADIYALNGTADANGTNTTATTPSADFKVLTKVVETAGAIVPASTEAVNLKKVAATGAAEDVTIADSGSLITATTVEGALQEIAQNVNNNHVVSNDVIVATPDTTNHETKLSVTIGNGLTKEGANSDTLNVALSEQAASTAADAAYAGGNDTSNILQIKDDGLYLDNVWDCGTFGAQS